VITCGSSSATSSTVDTPVPAPAPTLPTPAAPSPGDGGVAPEPVPLFTGKKVAAIRWRGTVPPQKWTTFYTKVLSRLVSDVGLELNVEFEAQPPGGLHAERADEIRQHLRELGVAEDIKVEEAPE
jgi:hypothetical protein